MHFNWTNKLLAPAFAALSMITSLYAIPRGSCDRPNEELCCENPEPGPFAFAYPMDIELNCPHDFYFHLDGLALQAKQDGMAFAIVDGTSDVGQPMPPITYGRVIGFSWKNSDWDYNPGFRAGFGFYLDHDTWTVDFNWTWLNITNYKHGDASSSGSILIPLWNLGNLQAISANLLGTNSSAVWKAHYNTLDLNFGKPYHISRYVIFNPYFGVRAGWIDQHFSVDYGGPPNIPEEAALRIIHHGDNNFWGVGLRGGLNTDWIIGKGWCLFANASASILSSKFEVYQNLVNPPGSGLPTGDGFDVQDDSYQNVPNMEIAFGIAWDKYFDENKYRVGLRAAYEFIQWWDQLNMRKFFSGNPGYANDTVSRGNLTLNGFSLRLQFDI